MEVPSFKLGEYRKILETTKTLLEAIKGNWSRFWIFCPQISQLIEEYETNTQHL
jgi:hypothetical protein